MSLSSVDDRAAAFDLSAAQARELAVAAVGWNLPDSRDVLRHTGLLQLDPLSRVDKAHRLTCLARTSPAHLVTGIAAPLWNDESATAFETWVHAVCLVPAEDWPLLRLARERVRASPRRPPQRLLDDVLRVIEQAATGATISDIEATDAGNASAGTAGWDWSARKHAVEYLLRAGDVICSRRRGTKRVFDLPERCLPADTLAEHLPTDTILAALVRKALAAMGIATANDISRYYNLRPSDARRGIEAAGAQSVRVEGWADTAWVAADLGAPAPPAPHDPVLIGPFDNLIWDRARTRRLFDLDYVFEAYKPAARRIYGYYVLAVLAGDALVGRADMRRGPLGVEVIRAFPAPGVDDRLLDKALTSARVRLDHQLGLGDPA